LVLKLCTPEPAVKVPALEIPPFNEIGELPELFQIPPLLIVTKPVKVLIPVEEPIFRVPFTVVVPDTVRSKAPIESVAPASIFKLPRTDKLAARFIKLVPDIVKFEYLLYKGVTADCEPAP
jgi:hypothetical protein